MRTNGDVGNQDFGTSPAGSQSLSWFRNALEALQKCRSEVFNTITGMSHCDANYWWYGI
jgi:hypothetical protein